MKYILIDDADDTWDKEDWVYTNKDDLIDQLLSWLNMRVERR